MAGCFLWGFPNNTGVVLMADREKVISEFGKWCDAMEDECPVICLHALALLKEQQKLIDDMTKRRMDNGAFD